MYIFMYIICICIYIYILYTCSILIPARTPRKLPSSHGRSAGAHGAVALQRRRPRPLPRRRAGRDLRCRERRRGDVAVVGSRGGAGEMGCLCL